ncbi:MAG: hypothetical protein ACHQPI_12910 [Thermoanaerobaculia bacterium]
MSRFWIGLVAISLAASVPSPATGQTKAETIATSDHHVALTLTMPDAAQIEVIVRDGAMARLTRKSDGAVIGIAPRITDATTKTVGVMVFGINTLTDGNEIMQALETVTLNPGGQSTAVSSEGRWHGKTDLATATVADNTPMVKEITLIGVDVPLSHPTPKPRAMAGAPATVSNSRPVPMGRCCLSCGGWEACGCAVYCGGDSCCTGGCCAY